MKESQKEELEKCKNDIVYFVETYLYPKVKLSDFQKEILKAHQEGKQVMQINSRSGKRVLFTSMKKYNELKMKKGGL